MTDLKDPDGKVVTASVDYDRSSDTFGEKVTEYKVQTVKRTHDGDAIRYAKTNEAGDVLYRGETRTAPPSKWIAMTIARIRSRTATVTISSPR